MLYKPAQLQLMGIAHELSRQSAELTIQARKPFTPEQIKRVGTIIAGIRNLAEQAAQLDNEGL